MRSSMLGSLAVAVPRARLIGDAGTVVSDIVYHSRRVTPGALFAALRGSDFDGHDFVAAAVEQGAAALLVEEEQAIDMPQIVAQGSSRAALAQVACEFEGHPSRELTVIGVTGTDGKTTTTAMLRTILVAAGYQIGTIGTVGIEIGDGTRHDLGHQTTPESNLVQRFLREMAEAGTTHAVIEATSHGLATHRLDGVRFRAGGLTNITREHLEFHKTIENYRRAKAILLGRVAEERGVVVINNDDDGARSVESHAKRARIVLYSGSGEAADLRATAIRAERTGLS
ncbi:MAG TPA: Mur ligase family protein, partial [Thermomicrobiales bacterium]|nr:Mur ligase family protein [Thermomicrobiales bacterium]